MWRSRKFISPGWQAEACPEPEGGFPGQGTGPPGPALYPQRRRSQQPAPAAAEHTVQGSPTAGPPPPQPPELPLSPPPCWPRPSRRWAPFRPAPRPPPWGRWIPPAASPLGIRTGRSSCSSATKRGKGCLAEPPDPNSPASYPDNFPEEAFWFAAEASGGNLRLYEAVPKGPTADPPRLTWQRPATAAVPRPTTSRGSPRRPSPAPFRQALRDPCS